MAGATTRPKNGALEMTKADGDSTRAWNGWPGKAFLDPISEVAA